MVTVSEGVVCFDVKLNTVILSEGVVCRNIELAVGSGPTRKLSCSNLTEGKILHRSWVPTQIRYQVV